MLEKCLFLEELKLMKIFAGIHMSQKKKKCSFTAKREVRVLMQLSDFFFFDKLIHW